MKPIDITFSQFMRFLSFIGSYVGDYKDSSKCWIWNGGRDTKGYGYFHIRRSMFKAHRISYSVLIGTIPDGLTIDHLCKNRACVNPWHMEPVTNNENVRRGDHAKARAIFSGLANQRSARTHCKHGHEYTPENTVWRTDGGGRACRSCLRNNDHRFKARRRDAQLSAG